MRKFFQYRGIALAVGMSILTVVAFIYIVSLSFSGKIEIPNEIAIGDIRFRLYGIIVVFSVLVSAIVFEKIAGKIPKFDIYEALIWAMIPGIIFARIFYFIQNIPTSDLSEIYKLWNGGLSIFGAIVGSIIGLIIYLRRTKIKLFPVLDIVFITIPLGHAIGRWANFINQEIYGPTTNLPWKMYVKGAFYHPLFLYEFILNLFLFGLLFFLFKQKKKRFDGFFISIYLVGYGVIRFFMEFLRTDPKIYLNLSAAQYISMVMILVGSGYLIFKSKRSGKS